jgi:hypothetical protein
VAQHALEGDTQVLHEKALLLPVAGAAAGAPGGDYLVAHASVDHAGWRVQVTSYWEDLQGAHERLVQAVVMAAVLEAMQGGVWWVERQMLVLGCHSPLIET